MRTPAITRRFIADNPPVRVLINSVPKSGTTWMRTMLTMLPGYEEYPRDGITGLQPDELGGVEKGQVFHGHLLSSTRLFRILMERDFVVAFIYRDLRDVVVSDYFHRTKLNPKRKPELFDRFEKDELFLPANLEQWCGSVARFRDVPKWIDSGYPTVRYEDLLRSPEQEFGRVLSEMGFSVPNELVSHIVTESSFERQSGRARGVEDPSSQLRKGVIGDWRNHFSDRVLGEFMTEYGSLLEQLGYESG